MKTTPLNFLVLLSISFIFTGSAFAQNNPDPTFLVVLDAGHGGKDPGNRGGGFSEKDIALNIVLKIGAQLEKNNNNIEVKYTRDKDVFIPLDQRAKIANDAKADLFVSVHCNAHNSQAYGTETFVLGLHRNQTNFEVAKRENSVIFLEEDYDVTYGGFDPNSPESYIGMMIMQEEYLDQSILLADFVQKKFTNELKRNNRGVKQAGFLVLHQTYMPSVLIETGFLTNTSEGAYLNSANGQNKMAEAITKAIEDYSHTINLATLENLTENMAVGVVTAEEIVDIYDDVTFKVQLAASSKKLNPVASNFKGLSPVFREKEGKLYKYYYGATSNYPQIQKLHQQAKSKGYPSSYIVAFKQGNKITVNEALNTRSK